MRLQEQFEKDGNWLFKRRSYLPLALLVFVALALLDGRYLRELESAEHVWEIVCLAVSFLGLAIRAYTVGHTYSNTSGRNTTQKAARLNTSGIYSMVRHPLYLGNFFMFLGVMLLPHNIWLILVFILLFALYYERIMYAEEAFLDGKFGDEFQNWAQKTPAIIPALHLYRASDVPFSLKKVLRREYDGFYGVIISMFLITVARDWIIQNRLEIDPHWIAILVAGTLIWAVLRILNKRTGLLKENKG
jgi:protein-S-isoprenylcysteine O-methyltransferase Ste14